MNRQLKRLFTILAVMLILAGCANEQKQALSGQMKQQIALLPQDAGIYAYINVKRLHNASFSHIFIDSARKQIMNNPEFLELVEQTGLDPEKDIREVYFALKPGSSKEKPLGLIVAGGDFEPQKITDFLKKKDKHKKILTENYKEKTLYYIKENAPGFCFIDAHTVVAGNLDQVKRWIDRQEAGGSVAANKDLLSQVQKMKYGNGLWLNVIPAAWQEMLKTKDLKKFNGLKKLRGIRISMDITDQVMLSANGGFVKEEDAQLFSDAFKGLIAAGKLSVSDEREIVDILNKVDVKTTGNEISIDFKMSGKEVRKLLEKKKKLRRKMMPV